MIFLIFDVPLLWRGGIAFFFCLALFFLVGKRFVKWLEEKGMVDYFRTYSPSHHKSKRGTPSGAGVLFLFCLGVVFLLFAHTSNQYLWIALLVTFLAGLIGFADDVVKRLRGTSQGLSIRVKLLVQGLTFTLVVLLLIFIFPELSTKVKIPFVGSNIDFGVFYFPLMVLIILSSSNAVNVTDGLDGLVAGCMIAPAAVFVLLSITQADAGLSSSLNRIFLPGSGELAFFWVAIMGSVMGFLRYNKYPASMFMGGVGAESLGAALGISAILLKTEVLFLFIGGVFVLEGISVIIQVIAFRLTGKRVFKMTPLHHHFELCGMREAKIVAGFWIASFIFCAIAVLGILL